MKSNSNTSVWRLAALLLLVPKVSDASSLTSYAGTSRTSHWLMGLCYSVMIV